MGGGGRGDGRGGGQQGLRAGAPSHWGRLPPAFDGSLSERLKEWFGGPPLDLCWGHRRPRPLGPKGWQCSDSGPFYFVQERK